MVVPSTWPRELVKTLAHRVDPVVFQDSAEVTGSERRRRLLPYFRRWWRVAVIADATRGDEDAHSDAHHDVRRPRAPPALLCQTPFALERLHALAGVASLASSDARLLYRFPKPTPERRLETEGASLCSPAPV
jgi:hypothetical protein